MNRTCFKLFIVVFFSNIHLPLRAKPSQKAPTKYRLGTFARSRNIHRKKKKKKKKKKKSTFKEIARCGPVTTAYKSLLGRAFTTEHNFYVIGNPELCIKNNRRRRHENVGLMEEVLKNL